MNAMPDAQATRVGSPHQQMDVSGTTEFSDMLLTLWRGKVWLVLMTLIGIALGLYHALAVAEAKYQATAVVVMDGGPDPVVQFSDFLPTLSGDQTIVNTELEVLRSTSLARDVVIGADLLDDPEFNTTLAPKGLKDTVLSRAREVLGVMQPPPNEVRAANLTISSLRRALSVRNVPDSMVFEITVESSDPAKATTIANLFASRYLERQLETKFEATQQATEWLAQKVAELEVDLEASEAEMNAFAAQMELISAETLDILSAELRDVRDRIAAREEAVTRGEATTRTAARLADLRVLESELADKIAAQSRDSVTLEQLQREAGADRQIYEYFLARLKETSVQEGIQQADARILSLAMLPDVPTTPRPVLSSGLGGVLALMAMALFLIVREAQTATFRTADDLEDATGLPVFGQIPQIAARHRKSVLEHIRTKPNSAAVEAIRNLRTSLMMSNGAAPPQIILTTSSLPGEGKTTQTLALAQNLTGVRRRVLVIEGDVRKRVFREYFGAPIESGISDVLLGKASLENAVWHHETLGFDILFASDMRGNAADILAGSRFRKLLRAARKTYDVVLIDTPPVLLVPDARVIAPLADAVLYIVRWDRTRTKQVQQGLKAFQTVGVDVTGTVLSQVSPRGLRRYGYGKDYGTYGTSGYYQT